MRNLIIILCIGVLLTSPIAAAGVMVTAANDQDASATTARIDGIDWDEWLEGITLTWDEFLGYMGMSWDQWEEFMRIDGIDWDEWMENWTVPPPPSGSLG